MPQLLVSETSDDYLLEMCPQDPCPAPTDPDHTRTHFRRTWGKLGTSLVQVVVRTTNPNGTVAETLVQSPGPISLAQIQQEFTLLYQAQPPA